MVYRYSDYSGNDDTPSLPLLVSERTQQLVLAVLKSVESEYAWVGNFDDIDAMVADALTEMMESATLGTLGGCSIYRSTTQNIGSPINTWHPVEMDSTYYDTDDYKHGASITNYLEVPANGIYFVSAHVTFNANGTAENTGFRMSRVLVNGAQVISLNEGSIISRNSPHIHSVVYPMNAGDIVLVECFTNIPNLLINAVGSYSPRLTVERLR